MHYVYAMRARMLCVYWCVCVCVVCVHATDRGRAGIHSLANYRQRLASKFNVFWQQIVVVVVVVLAGIF